MCDPLTIAGIALTAGSTVANSMAASKVTQARNDALAAERVRQRGYDAEAAALNTQSQDRYKDFGGQQEAKAQDLGDYFAGQKIANQSAANEQAAGAAMPTSASNLAVQEEAKQRAKASAFTDAQGQSLGQLRSFGDLLGGIGREQAQDASLIGQIGGFKKGSSAVTPYELEAANQKGNGLKLFGDVLNLGGSLATAAGLSGKSLGNLFGGAAMSPADKLKVSYYSLYG